MNLDKWFLRSSLRSPPTLKRTTPITLKLFKIIHYFMVLQYSVAIYESKFLEKNVWNIKLIARLQKYIF